MTDGGEAGLPFSGGFSSWYGQDFFKPKNLGFEDQIEAFPYFFYGPTFGKILSVFGGPNLAQHVGRLPR